MDFPLGEMVGEQPYQKGQGQVADQVAAGRPHKDLKASAVACKHRDTHCP